MADKVDFGPRIGCDPELFVIAKKEDDGKKKTRTGIIPVCGLVGGNKDTPIKLDLKKDPALNGYVMEWGGEEGYYGFLEDNVAFELNTPAWRNAEAFAHNIQGYLCFLEDVILKPKNLTFSWANRHRFPEKMLQHPFSQAIGCEPDFDAYQPIQNQQRKPFGIANLGLNRFCGGHLHVQYNTNNIPRHVFARYMDIIVGLAFLPVDRQGERREFYGKGGLYRPKIYGVEYRTPSNFWVNPKQGLSQNGKGTPVCRQIANNVFALARQANEHPQTLSRNYRRIPWPEVKQAIDTENVQLAQDILRHIQNDRMIGFGIYYHNGEQYSSI